MPRRAPPKDSPSRQRRPKSGARRTGRQASPRRLLVSRCAHDPRRPDRGRRAVDRHRTCVEVTDDPAALDGAGRWMVAITFEGRATLARFATWERRPPTADEVGRWEGPDPGSWTLLPRRGRLRRRGRGRARPHQQGRGLPGQHLPHPAQRRGPGRRTSWPCTAGSSRATRHRTPGALRLPEHGVHIASASPELYLRRDGQRRHVATDQGHRRRAPRTCWPRTRPRT